MSRNKTMTAKEPFLLANHLDDTANETDSVSKARSVFWPLVTTSLLATAAVTGGVLASRTGPQPPASAPQASNKMAQAVSFDEVCSGNNWDRGADAVDPDAPPKPWPASGQMVYIHDPNNYCLNMPNPKDPYLIENYWSRRINPTFVDAEGHVQAFCVGELTPGGLPFPPGAVKSLHIRKNQSFNGKAYHQITGTIDCAIMNMTCSGDDGGQYDSVPYRNCGKEPYSGVDTSKNSGFTDYVEIGGEGTFCMRTCVAGQVDGDPCSAKGDTLGCGVLTQGTDDYSDGFTMTDGDGAPVSFKPTTGVTAMHGTIMVPSATAQALPTTGPLSATTPLSSQTVQAMTGSVGDVMTESSISIEYGATQPLKFSTSASPTSSKYVDPVPALKSGADACAIPFLSVFLILLL